MTLLKTSRWRRAPTKVREIAAAYVNENISTGIGKDEGGWYISVSQGQGSVRQYVHTLGEKQEQYQLYVRLLRSGDYVPWRGYFYRNSLLEPKPIKKYYPKNFKDAAVQAYFKCYHFAQYFGKEEDEQLWDCVSFSGSNIFITDQFLQLYLTYSGSYFKHVEKNEYYGYHSGIVTWYTL